MVPQTTKPKAKPTSKDSNVGDIFVCVVDRLARLMGVVMVQRASQL